MTVDILQGFNCWLEQLSMYFKAHQGFLAAVTKMIQLQIVNRAYRVLTYICYQNNAATTCLLYRTKKAMGGSVPFHEALSTRLGLIQPSLQQIADFIRPRLCNPEVVLTPGVR